VERDAVLCGFYAWWRVTAPVNYIINECYRMLKYYGLLFVCVLRQFRRLCASYANSDADVVFMPRSAREKKYGLLTLSQSSVKKLVTEVQQFASGDQRQDRRSVVMTDSIPNKVSYYINILS
jgi:hypothetical protein